jgi:hypothetical protein
MRMLCSKNKSGAGKPIRPELPCSAMRLASLRFKAQTKKVLNAIHGKQAFSRFLRELHL